MATKKTTKKVGQKVNMKKLKANVAKKNGTKAAPKKPDFGPVEAFCMKCKKKRFIKNAEHVDKGGRHFLTGPCVKCGTRMMKIVSSSFFEKPAEPVESKDAGAALSTADAKGGVNLTLKMADGEFRVVKLDDQWALLWIDGKQFTEKKPQVVETRTVKHKDPTKDSNFAAIIVAMSKCW
jgi:hypothetical protein